MVQYYSFYYYVSLKNIDIIVVLLINVQEVNFNIYEGDDNIIGYNDYNLNRVLSTGQIDL